MRLDLRPAFLVAALTSTAAGSLAACSSSEAKPTGGEAAPSTTEAVPAGSTLPVVAEAIVEAVAEAGADAEADAAPAAIADAGADAEADGGSPPVCPPEMLKTGRACVDRWEAHLATKTVDGVVTPWPHYDRPEKGTFYLAMSGAGFYPQAYISRVEAAEACAHAGKRLCSRAEWTRACKGRKGYRYPYGNKGQRGACNTGKLHLLEKFYGRSRGAWTYEVFNDPKLDREPGFLAKSGEYETCGSDEGAFDMVGNLHEWVSDAVGSDIEDVMARDEVERKKQPWKVGNGIFMGGFFSTTLEHGPGCSFTTIAHEPTYHDYSTGFRCCMDAPGVEKKPRKKKR
ncbi:formylglycine-generating enzyme family protein [Polyangium mundeleinium]|uniref:SUMF1/EgtB/PvdO family nonheme iron enzyme n=1 Tax=Polyangium mundeleinium TaxID=2995306 RepID=A0ABT5EFV4_9BACT|nr:SUMF1/EgtB/PvdO family nonheme iron enzyme [Polyangium mundeleinium]MDC0740227.1 SUMF1/EgtB/PvdO family nonheme iron enzyme [Polyangium mundeleinium]